MILRPVVDENIRGTDCLIVEYQKTDQENRRSKNRLKNAKLRLFTYLEDLTFKQGLGLDRSIVMSLAQNQRVQTHHNILVTGPTGASNSYLPCALAQKACRDGCKSQPKSAPTALGEQCFDSGQSVQLTHGAIIKFEVVILDDLLISSLVTVEQREILKIVEERYDRK